jgi:hypothetical protein
MLSKGGIKQVHRDVVRTWVAIALVSAVLGAGSSVTGAMAQNSSVASSIHLVWAGGPGTVTHNHGHGLVLGDRFVAKGALTDHGTGQRVGTAYLDCVVVTHQLVGGAFWCRWLLDLSGGNIMVEGLDPQGLSDTFFSITGGTHQYRAISGEAEFIDGQTGTDIYINL